MVINDDKMKIFGASGGLTFSELAGDSVNSNYSLAIDRYTVVDYSTGKVQTDSNWCTFVGAPFPPARVGY